MYEQFYRVLCVFTLTSRCLCARFWVFRVPFFHRKFPATKMGGWNIINSWFIISNFQRFSHSITLAIPSCPSGGKKKCHSYCCYISYPIVIIFSACHQIKEKKISITIIPNNGAWWWRFCSYKRRFGWQKGRTGSGLSWMELTWGWRYFCYRLPLVTPG